MNIDRHVGVFFCNGLNVDRQEARKNADEIEDILNAEVIHPYNDGTKDLKIGARNTLPVTTLTAFAGGFIFGPVGGLFGGIVGGLALKKSLIELNKSLHEIDKNKNGRSHKLAQLIQNFLEQNPLNRTLLILHSQGRDVGRKALKILSPKYIVRIRTVVLGALPIIKLNFRVKNFRNFLDYVPTLQYIKDRFFLGKNPKIIPPFFDENVTFLFNKGHSVHGYLSQEKVATCIRKERNYFLEEIGKILKIKQHFFEQTQGRILDLEEGIQKDLAKIETYKTRNQIHNAREEMEDIWLNLGRIQNWRERVSEKRAEIQLPDRKKRSEAIRDKKLQNDVWKIQTQIEEKMSGRKRKYSQISKEKALNSRLLKAKQETETASKRHKCTLITIIEGGRYCSHDGDYKGKSSLYLK